MKLTVSDIQFDNQLFARESYDFPVVLIGQEKKKKKKLVSLNVPIESLLESTDETALIIFDFIFQTWRSRKNSLAVTGMFCYYIDLCLHLIRFLGVKSVKMTVNPISFYLEDTYITRVVDYLKILMPNKLVLWQERKMLAKLNLPAGSVRSSQLILLSGKDVCFFRFAFQNLFHGSVHYLLNR